MRCGRTEVVTRADSSSLTFLFEKDRGDFFYDMRNFVTVSQNPSGDDLASPGQTQRICVKRQNAAGSRSRRGNVPGS